MSLRPLLGERSLEQFLREHYLKLPLAMPDVAQPLRELGSWEMLRRILEPPASSPAQEPPTPTPPAVDMLVARHDRLWEGAGTPDFPQAVSLFQEGYTLVVRNAQRHDSQLAQLAAGFAAELAGVVNIHMYFTPPGEHGFAWHYDAEEVFIVQTSGRKEYQLRKNTVQPWPLEETIPANMRYEREIMPLSRTTLATGDWLYIPTGYWHRAEAAADCDSSEPTATTEPSHPPAAISLAIGVMAPAAIQVLDLLRQQLPESILWRQRLPIAEATATPHQDPSAQQANWETILQMLADDLQKTIRQPSFQQALRQHLQQQAGLPAVDSKPAES